MKINNFFICILIPALILASCQNTSKVSQQTIPIQEMYNNGLTALRDENYAEAAKKFEEIFYQYPGHEMTAQAEIMNAYALYKNDEYAEAIDVLDIFLKLHPRHKNADYAYYLRALSYYVQISDVKLDQSRTENALYTLNEVIEKYPNSKYATDAALKIDLVRDHLAGKEMTIGRYYLNRNNPIAAIKRFQNVLQEYGTTSHITECLYRLVEANEMLGLRDEALKYHEVLKLNYPKSEWFEYSNNLIK